jgi:hypothetical protein
MPRFTWRASFFLYIQCIKRAAIKKWFIVLIIYMHKSTLNISWNHSCKSKQA